MQKQKASETDIPFGQLGCVFKFTPVDLEVNRTGFLSLRQQIARREDFTWRCLFGFVLYSILLYIFWYAEKGQTVTPFFLAVLAIVLGLGLLSIILADWYRTWNYLHCGKIHVYEGVATDEPWQNSLYGFKVLNENARFPLSKAQYEAMSRGRYFIYVSSQSKEILSIELALPELG